MQGQYLNMYEIPFFSNAYLKADTTDNWSIGGSEKAVGQELATMLQENFSVNFPMMPVWSKSNESNLSIENEFFLINNSTDNLVNNFRFLTSLTAANFWVQLGFVQQPPNVFDVVVPGRFHMYYAALGVVVDYVGKVRENPKAVEKLALSGLREDNLFPDGYKVTIAVRDLTPNNFNVFVEFLNKDLEKIQIGDVRTRVNPLTLLGGENAIGGAAKDALVGLNKLVDKATK